MNTDAMHWMVGNFSVPRVLATRSMPVSLALMPNLGVPMALAQSAKRHYLRDDVCKISLMEAERRSGRCHQFWSKVERGGSHPSSHKEVCLASARRVRPHVFHRLTERWLRLGRKLKLLLQLLPVIEPAETAAPGRNSMPVFRVAFHGTLRP